MRQFRPQFYDLGELPPPANGNASLTPRDDWQRSNESGILYMAEVGTGLVLAAHNPTNNRGILGHFDSLPEEPGVDEDEDGFEAAIEASFLLSRSHPEQTVLWLGGTVGLDRAQIVELDEERSRTERLAARIIDEHSGGAAGGLLTVEWFLPGTLIDVALDCRLAALSVLRRRKSR